MFERSSYRYAPLVLVAAILWSPTSHLVSVAQNEIPGPNQAQIETFLESFVTDTAKTGWKKQDRHLSGVEAGGVHYSVHRYIEAYYSSAVDTWLTHVPSKASGGPADGAVIVALEYDALTGGTLQRAATMVRHHPADGPADGWYWSSTVFAADGTVDRAKSQGGSGESTCFACHGSANNDGLVFLDGDNGPFPTGGWQPDARLRWPSPPPPMPTSSPKQPNAGPDAEFLGYFDLTNVTEAVPFPAKVLDHVWAGDYAGTTGTETERFITSDQCLGCHNAGQLLSNSSPNMWYAEPEPATHLLPDNPDPQARRNFSPYGEWSASINALSGRDPVWHAQVDFERRLRPELADFTNSTCFSCHGAMATRQLQTDLGDPFAFFTIDMFYATGSEPHAKYGALARDGVSCAVCHQISAENLGKDPVFRPWNPDVPRTGPDQPSGYFLPSIDELNSYTALFDVTEGADAAYWGPYPDTDIASAPMDRVLGQRAREASHISESKLCGSCHTVLVPALPVGYELPPGITDPFLDPNMKMSFEQTTYFEWRNSTYENEQDPANPRAIRCQGCHMTPHARETRIVNAESDRFPPVQGRDQGMNDFKDHTPYPRHILLGINYFVFEMYEQFADLLGTKLHDARVPAETVDTTVNARDWVENHAARASAETRITSVAEVDGNLEVTVQVTNLTGHKLPTGAGFRRAFIDFQVLDEGGNPLWWSGRPNALGVIVGADGMPLKSEESIKPEDSQPHYTEITRQDQAQIYETRALNSQQELQTTVLGIYYEYKDNRLPPLGFAPPKAFEDDPGRSDSQTRRATGAVLVGPSNLTAMQKEEITAQGYEDAVDHPTVLDNGTRPYTVTYDPDYWTSEGAARGQDNIVYKIPLSSIPGWATVTAQLRYQTIPPYYLRDRFQTYLPASERFPKERDMNRLIYVASRLNLAGTPAEGWSLKVGAPAVGALGRTQPPLTPEEVWAKLRDYYRSLGLQ